MASILVVGVAAPSHIQPSLPVVRELARRGHAIHYAVDAAHAGLVAAAGAAPLVLPTGLPGPGGSWPEDEVGGLAVFLDEAIAVLPALEMALAELPEPPALVLHDVAAIAGPVLAARLGVPAVLLSPAAVAWEGYAADLPPEALATWASPDAERLLARFAGWLGEQGVALTPDTVLSEPRRGLALIPRAMQPHADKVHERWSFVGPLLDGERAEAGAWTPPGDGRRVLLVAFGTAYDDQAAVHRAAVEGLAGDAWHLVLAVGRTDPAAVGPLPEVGVELHARVPQLAVLAHADAFVTHAGMGSCAEALWFGVPTVAVPQAVDQFANAARLAELGVGVVLDAGAAADPGALRAAVRFVSADAGVRARTAALREEVRAGGSAARAADLVEAELPGEPA